ncbi:DUF6259 domain-containing protein [Flavobacteriaceae bacterium F89]|uniref:DUF6259 domain-containing protein n=1 Tax=Cerina litoralis TaxID=2874477 RepID=A0AAE3JS56_9FLAO|nr:DUF6259 domain-containing protein [Cerina litoralis]MCG2462088.1 DUF6259 domain-containing protein [Cerina litoralis]
MKPLITFLFFFYVTYIGNCQIGDHFQMTTSVSTLTHNDRDKIYITNKDNEVNLVLNAENLWDVTLVNKLTKKEYILNNKSVFGIEESVQKLRFYINDLYLDDISTTLNAEFTIEVKNDAFHFSGNLRCSSEEWILKSLDYPKFSKIKFGKEDTKIYWPVGLGQHFKGFSEFGKERALDYPSAGATMPWFSLNSDNFGLYIGVHDSQQRATQIKLSRVDKTSDFSSNIYTPIYKHDYKVPEYVLKPYEGSWHIAAKNYRSWYDENFKVATPPDWVISDTGWLLAILKQQNGNVMWPYKDIDKLCDIAEKFNLTTIGLFGWAIGGHDHLYPNYLPDPLMGGEQVLKDAIKRAHDRGIKVIIYANGKLIDTSTDYYRYRGIEAMAIGADKRPRADFYVKYNNTSPVVFCWACTGSDYWRKTMHNLALQAQSLGADGILYDQLGVLPPELCFSTHHDHDPGHSDSEYRLRMIRKIREDLKKKDSHFIVMTEASNSSVLQEIDYTHGVGLGYAPGINAFPDLYKYTFPELRATQRNGNPLLTRTDANYALMYGLKHEVEIRYTGDVEYLLNGTAPNANSYSTVNYPPDINKMKSMSMEESSKYLHSLIDFENLYGNFLKRGKFISDEGITIDGKDVIARGFINGDELGVVAWNKNETEYRDFEIKVNGYKYVSSHEPSKRKVKYNTQLQPNAVRILIFKKM